MLDRHWLLKPVLCSPVTLNGQPVFDFRNLPTPTAGTYLIAMTPRLRGEYILSVDGYYATQTVHLMVEANQYDGGATLQVLDNHSYSGAVMVNNFRVLLPPGDASTAYLVMDVVGNLMPDLSTVVHIQYQGSAGYGSGLSSAGGTIPSGTRVVGSTGLAVNETNVGIGTASPGAKLEVNGNVKLTAGSGASITFPDGTIQSTAWTGTLCGGDYAESVKAIGDRASYEPGDVLVISEDKESDIAKSNKPYSTLVSGIYSTKPGLVGRRQPTTQDNQAEVPMAMIGIVPTKVSAENGPIKRGDLLVTSSAVGYAMKGTDTTRMLGAVIGKALGSLQSGNGTIEVLVTLQ